MRWQGFLVSIVLTAVMFGFQYILAEKNETTFDVQVSAILSLLIGLTAILFDIALLIKEIRDRQEADRKIDTAYLDYITNLPAVDDRNRNHIAYVFEYASSMISVLKYNHNLVREHAAISLRDDVSRLEELKEGIRVVRKTDSASDRELAAVKIAKRSYDAISMHLMSAYWEDQDGAILLEKNRIAVADGVTIRRIFILPEGRQDDHLSLINKHYSIGVHCYIAYSKEVEEKDRRDIGIVDGDKVGVEIIESFDPGNKFETKFYYPSGPESEATRSLERLGDTWDSVWKIASKRQYKPEVKSLGEG